MIDISIQLYFHLYLLTRLPEYPARSTEHRLNADQPFLPIFERLQMICGVHIPRYHLLNLRLCLHRRSLVHSQRTIVLILLTLLQLTHIPRNLPRMNPIHADHGDEHHRCVKDVQEDFMRHNVSSISLKILDHANNTSDQYKG